jgi:hypothetical protein
VTSRGRSTDCFAFLSRQGKARQGKTWGFGGSGHLDSRSSTLALILQYASGLGPEPEKELALDTHHVRRFDMAKRGHDSLVEPGLRAFGMALQAFPAPNRRSSSIRVR